MTKLITVFGATGNQGGSVVRAILSHPQLSKEWKIRGITRDPTNLKPNAQKLVSEGVEFVKVSSPSHTHPHVPPYRAVSPPTNH
jgi:uncharacterized protein YbjT (DUF2867 family)